MCVLFIFCTAYLQNIICAEFNKMFSIFTRLKKSETSGTFDRWLLARCQPPSTPPRIWTHECRQQIKRKQHQFGHAPRFDFIFFCFCGSHKGLKKPIKNSKVSPEPHCRAASRNRGHIGSWHPARGHMRSKTFCFSIWNHCKPIEIELRSLCFRKLLDLFFGRKWVSRFGTYHVLVTLLVHLRSKTKSSERRVCGRKTQFCTKSNACFHLDSHDRGLATATCQCYYEAA